MPKDLAIPTPPDEARQEHTIEKTLVLDFDGTVTEADLLDEVASRFGDPEIYREVEAALVAGTMPLREVITREFRPVTKPVDEVVAWALESVRIRPGLRELVGLAHARGWQVVVISSGFHELIEPILAHEGVSVEVHANRLDPRPDGWRVLWNYDDGCESCGESCKRSTLARLARGQEVVYVGDGYSDRCAAQAADRVFATRGLARYLDERGIAYEPFADFRDITAALR